MHILLHEQQAAPLTSAMSAWGLFYIIVHFAAEASLGIMPNTSSEALGRGIQAPTNSVMSSRATGMPVGNARIP